jgi:hypothetical protein
MDMEEWVLFCLREHRWNPEAAQRQLEKNLGGRTPRLEYFRCICREAAQELWRDLIQKHGVKKMVGREKEIVAEMGALHRHLDCDDAAQVRLDEERRERFRNPRPYMAQVSCLSIHSVLRSCTSMRYRTYEVTSYEEIENTLRSKGYHQGIG